MDAEPVVVGVVDGHVDDVDTGRGAHTLERRQELARSRHAASTRSKALGERHEIRIAEAAAASPSDWLPWTYRATIARMAALSDGTIKKPSVPFVATGLGT